MSAGKQNHAKHVSFNRLIQEHDPHLFCKDAHRGFHFAYLHYQVQIQLNHEATMIN